jgi:type I restriction enzyme, S subunit
VDLNAAFKHTEFGVIPEDWSLSTVGAEFSVELGKMLDSDKNVGVLKPFLGNRAVQWGRIDLADVGTIKLTPWDMQRFRLRKGDLLVCEGGEVGRAAIWTAPIPECYYQKALHRLRAKRGYSATLMLNVLQYLAATKRLDVYVTQTSIAHLPKDKFETVPIPVPSTDAEQKAIAETLTDADALIESLEQLLAKKRHIKQGYLQALLTGKKRLPGFELKPGFKNTEVGSIPFDWNLRRLADLFTFQNGVNADRSAYGHGVPFANVMEVITHPVITEAHMPGRVSLPAEAVRTFALRFGDVLFNRTSETQEEVGLSAVYLGSAVAVFGGFVIRARPRDRELNSEFMGYMLRSATVRAQITSQGQGAVRANVGQHDLSQIQVALPGPEEQAAIAGVIRAMNREIDVIEERLNKARQIKQGMMQNLLTGRIRLVDAKAAADLELVRLA